MSHPNRERSKGISRFASLTMPMIWGSRHLLHRLTSPSSSRGDIFVCDPRGTLISALISLISSGTDLTVILNELRDRVELVEVVQGDQIVIHPGKGGRAKQGSTSTTQRDRKQTQKQSQKQATQHANTSKPKETTGHKVLQRNSTQMGSIVIT